MHLLVVLKEGKCAVFMPCYPTAISFLPELQEAVSQLAHQEIQMIKDIITSGQNSGEFKTVLLPDELAVIVCSTLKGALMLNRLPPHDTYSGTVNALIKMLDTRT